MSLTLTCIDHKVCTEIIADGTPLTENDFIGIHEKIEDLLAEEQPNVIINLEKINLLNSLGLNSLIKIFTKCRNNGGDMYIVNISDKINQVLLLTKLNTVLNIASSVQEAVNNFKN